MTASELNSKINLPVLARRLKLPNNLSFQKLPTFGWFAYTEDYSTVIDCFEAIKCEHYMDGWKLYVLATKNPDIQSFKLPYSEVIRLKVMQSYMVANLHRSFYNSCYNAARSEFMRYKGTSQLVKDVLEHEGVSPLQFAGVGLITPKIRRGYKSAIPDLKEEDEWKFVFPTFCTPAHIVSLEIGTCDKLDQLRPLWSMASEKGWYGNISHGLIVSDLKDLASTSGITWDPKLDYWLRKPVRLHKSLSTKHCIEIWSNTEHLICNPSPLEIIKNSGELDKIKENITNLSLAKVHELEKSTGETLENYWRQTKATSTSLGGIKLSCRSNCYYYHVERDPEGVPLTNFAIELTHLEKSKDAYYQCGLLYLNDREVPFRIEDDSFSRPVRLMRRLRKHALDAGAGLPQILSPNYKNYISDVIYAFNPVNPVKDSAPAVIIGEQLVPVLHPESKNEEVLRSQTLEPACQAQGRSLELSSIG